MFEKLVFSISTSISISLMWWFSVFCVCVKGRKENFLSSSRGLIMMCNDESEKFIIGKWFAEWHLILKCLFAYQKGIALAKNVVRHCPVGLDRNHDRYWILHGSRAGLYVEKGK